MRLWWLLFFGVGFCYGQSETPEDVRRITDGVTPPVPIFRPEPHYSAAARQAHVQGAVLMRIVISAAGRATNIEIISPLGYGLDETARQAVSAWRFKPATFEGKPVAVEANIEVNFRLLGQYFDRKAEQRRTAFNTAINILHRRDSEKIEKAVQAIADLAKENFPPALYLMGEWLQEGEHVPKDAATGEKMVQKAAEKKYAPAQFSLARKALRANQNDEKALDEVKSAALLGSTEAQSFLGWRSEHPPTGPPEVERAREYYRLCAARGVALCQYRLGALLLERPERREHHYLQAIAWLVLAAEQGQQDAQKLADAERAKLTQEQAGWVDRLKKQLVRS